MKPTQNTLTRDIIAERLHQHMGFSKNLCQLMVRDCFELITDELAHHRGVKIRDFGSFTIYHKAPRMARHIATGEDIYVPAKRTISFRPSTQLKKRSHHE